MSDTPVILANLGDGKQRRLFLGADELRQIKNETGRGFFTLYKYFHENAAPEEVAAVLRLALIGGGETPKCADELVSYYATAPRPLNDAYVIAYRCLNAAWTGEYDTGEKRPATDAEMDNFFITVEAALLKAGLDTSVLKGKSFGEIQAIFAAMKDEDDTPAAPDAEVFAAIKKTAKKGGKK